MVLFLVITNIVFICTTLFLWDELRHRDRHIRWVDSRDTLITPLYVRVMQSGLVPHSDFLGMWKQHGMFTANARANWNLLLTESEERIAYYIGFLKRALGEAKALSAWEASNRPPPVSRWKSRQAAFTDLAIPDPGITWVNPVPEQEPTEIEAEEQKALEAHPDNKPIGKGAFGPEGRPRF